MKVIELKPCPFCGEEARLITTLADGIHYIQCSNSNCCVKPRTVYYHSIEAATEVWNRRGKNG